MYVMLLNEHQFLLDIVVKVTMTPPSYFFVLCIIGLGHLLVGDMLLLDALIYSF